MKAVVANGGAAGIDGMTTEQVKAGAEEFLKALQAQLKDRSYQPGPVKRVWIPKADGKQRPLGVPTVRANCTPAQRVFGLGRHHPSVPSAAR
jgi:retron-type reverse transcriptase